LQGRYWLYHWSLLLPVLALGCAVMIVQGLRQRLNWTYLPALLAIAGLSFSVLNARTFYRERVKLTGSYNISSGDFDYDEIFQLADYVRNTTPPEARWFVWGSASLGYFLADRPVASEFVYNFPLFAGGTANPLRRTWRQRLLDDLAAAPPAVLVVAQGDISAGQPEDSVAELARFPRLAAWLADHYTHETDIGRYQVYRLK
jgi:hypothetical protein